MADHEQQATASRLPARDRPMSSAYANRRVVTVALLGFASGLPLALSESTLQAWLTVNGVDVRTIGVFSLVSLPYVFKFLWAPLLDRYQPGWPGRRRDWMLLTQIALAALLFYTGFADLAAGPLPLLALVAFAIAFMSATQDVAIDAYRTEILSERERGLGAGVAVSGYRIGMLVAGGGALLAADRIGFPQVYQLMALLLLVGIGASVSGPAVAADVRPPQGLLAAIVEPLQEFFHRESALTLLALVFLYKLGDAFAGALTMNFLLRELHFSLTDIGSIYKLLGLVASITGALVGGALMAQIGMYRAMVLFAWLQAISNLGFAALALIGKSLAAMMVVVGIENLAGGMGTTVFLAFLMSLCSARYTATQFALLSAVASIGRVIAGPPAAYLVKAWGWAPFFSWSFLLALPALVILRQRRALVLALEHLPTVRK